MKVGIFDKKLWNEFSYRVSIICGIVSFVVIFIDLIRNNKGKSAIIGAVGVFCAVICLIIFGADKFLLPSLLITVVILSSFKKFFETEEVAK